MVACVATEPTWIPGGHFSVLLMGACGEEGQRSHLADSLGYPLELIERWFEGACLPAPEDLPLIACALDLDPARVAVVWMIARIPVLDLPLSRLALDQGARDFLKVISRGVAKRSAPESKRESLAGEMRSPPG
jgi:hypothetical protein